MVTTSGKVVGIAFAIAPDRPTTAYALSTSELRPLLSGPHSQACVDRGVRRRLGLSAEASRRRPLPLGLLLDEDALPGALLGGLPGGVFHVLGHQRQTGVAAGIAEDLVALFDVGQAIVQQRENCRGNLLAQAIAGAKILVDPDLHALSVPFWSFETGVLLVPRYRRAGGSVNHSPGRPALVKSIRQVRPHAQ